MSVWTYSTAWPMWMGPLAYGSALVTRILSAMGSPEGRRTLAARGAPVIEKKQGLATGAWRPRSCYRPHTMCTLVILRHVHPEWPLVLASNRDENLARPAAGPQVLATSPRVVGGRDLERQGTWMG